MANFPKDLATYLETKIDSLTLGTNLLHNTRLVDNDNVPDVLVTILSYKPKKAERNFCGIREVSYKKALILVRGAEGANETAEDLAEDIYDYLQNADITPYKDVYFSQSGFEQNEKDEQNRYYWSALIEGWYYRIYKQELTYAQAQEIDYQEMDDQGIEYGDLT